jgi:hypothetical protein
MLEPATERDLLDLTATRSRLPDPSVLVPVSIASWQLDCCGNERPWFLPGDPFTEDLVTWEVRDLRPDGGDPHSWEPAGNADVTFSGRGNPVEEGSILDLGTVRVGAVRVTADGPVTGTMTVWADWHGAWIRDAELDGIRPAATIERLFRVRPILEEVAPLTFECVGYEEPVQVNHAGERGRCDLLIHLRIEPPS